MKFEDVYIVGAVRTAIGKYGGSLKTVPSHELGALVVKEALRRSGANGNEIDEVDDGVDCIEVLALHDADLDGRLECPAALDDLVREGKPENKALAELLTTGADFVSEEALSQLAAFCLTL